MLILIVVAGMRLVELRAHTDVSGTLHRVHIPRARALPDCPSTFEDEVGHALCRLPKGRVAFNAPATMTRGEPQIISAVMSVKELAPVLAQRVKAATGDSTSKIEVDTLRVGQRMRARLLGQGFDITPNAGDAVFIAVPKQGSVQWTWQVTPTKSGDQLLQLTLEAMLPLKSGDTPTSRTVLSRRVHVRVSALGWLSDFGDLLKAYWTVLLGLIAAASVLYRWLKARGQRGAGSQ